MKQIMTLVAALAAIGAWAGPLVLKVENDHADLLYRVGEEAVFTVTATDTNGVKVSEGQVSASLDNFGPKQVMAKQTFDLAKGNPFVVKGTLGEPGFLRLNLGVSGQAGKVWSVGYEPTKIRKGSPSPEDFDRFWAEAKAKLAREVPLDAKVEEYPRRSNKLWTMYKISFATFGRRLYGRMSVPKSGKAKYPVLFEVPGAGWGGWSNHMSGSADTIKVMVSVYPFDMQEDFQKPEAKALYDGMNAAAKAKWGSDNYSQGGITEGREAYFYYPVIVGIDRVVDWVAARPDVDRSNFRYRGTSQGGGMGLALTALNHTFTKAAFKVPAITDTMGYRQGRQSGWPRITESNRRELKAEVEKYAPYFDGANFASRVQCPVLVLVGFGDTTCAPCAVYAAYNELKCEKQIIHGPGMGHKCYPELSKKVESWILK